MMVVFLSACAIWGSGCGFGGVHYQSSESDETIHDTIDDPQPTKCPGECVNTAPATFTGPSLFWSGQVELAPECPPETPLQGLQGYLVGVAPPLFARECRVTPSDLCDTEGLTCAPLPGERFHICIHRDKAGIDCPTEYTFQSGMKEVGATEALTLCCLSAPDSP